MEYADILRHFGAHGYFELPNLLAFTGEKKPTVLQTLYRWNIKGWIIPIRRGLYTFPDDLAKSPLSAERAANLIQKQTYVTGLWLLNQLGLIPEGVTVVTSATQNNPAEFKTRIGRFAYQHIQRRGFFGYIEKPDGGGINVNVATPEKALLDFFWWKNVEWNDVEFERWRIQDPFSRLNHKQLKEFARQWDQPRLIRAAGNLSKYLKTTKALAPEGPIAPTTPMNRETEEKLVDFVASQHRDFHPANWLVKPHPTGATALELATVAHFLALTTFDHQVPLPAWASRKGSLLKVAEDLDANSYRSLQNRLKETGFQPDRFNNMLNATVAYENQPA